LQNDVVKLTAIYMEERARIIEN